MKDKDGGPAFPSPHMAGQTGITMRDYFAAKAMAALIAEPRWAEGQTPAVDMIGGTTSSLSTNYAKAAYAMADAMLAARDAKP